MTPPSLALYLLASRLAGGVAPMLLRRRAGRGREDPVRMGERLGRPGVRRPGGRLVWLHGASVGESLSMLPLIAELRRADADLAVLVTSGTVTSARRMQALLPPDAIHQFVPVDTAGAVRAFLRHWRPDLAIWVESELWPRLMVETAALGTPMMLVNARMSDKAARRWSRLPGMSARLVRLFTSVLTQDEETRRRLLALGAESSRVRVAGNLKVAIPPPAAESGALTAMSAAVAGRPVWLAASTHPPEEDVVAEAHRAAARALPGLLTILAPRHPERAGEVASLLAPLAVRRRSTEGLPDPETEVFLADTLGEMGLWLRLAPVTFVGGSIAPMGGHNPFEAAALGSAILHGPSTQNFGPGYAALDGRGAARLAPDAASLAQAISALLTEDGAPARSALTAAARTVLHDLTPDVAAIAAQALALMASR